MSYLLPYWERGDYEDRLLGILQLFFIACISLLKSIGTHQIKEGVLVFCLTFIFFVWLIKLLVALVQWLEEYARIMTLHIMFTLTVPLLVLFNMTQLKDQSTADVCLAALVMSVGIVYLELIQMILQKLTIGRRMIAFQIEKRLRLKSIFVWLLILLMNLYALLVFVQFYWRDTTYHFIEATHFTQKSAVDLLYYLMVTFTTVGLGDIQPHTEIAKLITILIAFSGMFFTGIFVTVVLTMETNN